MRFNPQRRSQMGTRARCSAGTLHRNSLQLIPPRGAHAVGPAARCARRGSGVCGARLPVEEVGQLLASVGSDPAGPEEVRRVRVHRCRPGPGRGDPSGPCHPFLLPPWVPRGSCVQRPGPIHPAEVKKGLPAPRPYKSRTDLQTFLMSSVADCVCNYREGSPALYAAVASSLHLLAASTEWLPHSSTVVHQKCFRVSPGQLL